MSSTKTILAAVSLVFNSLIPGKFTDGDTSLSRQRENCRPRSSAETLQTDPRGRESSLWECKNASLLTFFFWGGGVGVGGGDRAQLSIQHLSYDQCSTDTETQILADKFISYRKLALVGIEREEILIKFIFFFFFSICRI